MDEDVKQLLDHQSALATKRANWDSWWQQLTERALPSDAQFTTTTAEGERRTERLFDSSAVIANQRFASVMDDILTPRTQFWHGLAPLDDDLVDNQEAKEWYEAATKALFAMRYRPIANFASQKHQGYLTLGVIGNSCMFIDEIVSRDRSVAGPRYISVHMREVFWAQNHQGMIDTLYRKFPLEGRQALQKFGKDLPEKVAKAAEKNPFKEFEFLHCVRPNEDMKPGRKDYTGMPWSSYYACVDEPKLLSRGGFHKWPYAIGRYMLGARETYARSPAMAAYPAIMTLNEEKKTILRAGQKEVDPPLLLSDDGALEAFNLRPAALNHGYLNDQGEALVQPLKLGANIPLGLELMSLERKEIEDAFLVTIFQILAENPQMTATQVLEIAQQRATLLAPVMGRAHAEDLGPLIEMELDIASRAGLLPEVPDVLLERGLAYKVEYKSPLARAMRAQDGVAIMRTMEAVSVAVTIDPDAAMVLDVKAAVREVADINGTPAKLLRSVEDIEAMLENKAANEEAAQLVGAAPAISQAALNVSKAEQLRTGT